MNHQTTSKRAKSAVKAAGAIITGHFVFADGDHAKTKIEIDQLWQHQSSLDTILELLVLAEGLAPADVIVGVPRGGQDLAVAVAKRSGAPIALLERVPGGTKQDFRFASEKDRNLALSAHTIRIYEDVVTTLSSIAGVVQILSPDEQTIESLAIWRRGQIKTKYQRNVRDHYLVEELIPSFSPEECLICLNQVE